MAIASRITTRALSTFAARRRSQAPGGGRRGRRGRGGDLAFVRAAASAAAAGARVRGHRAPVHRGAVNGPGAHARGPAAHVRRPAGGRRPRGAKVPGGGRQPPGAGRGAGHGLQALLRRRDRRGGRGAGAAPLARRHGRDPGLRHRGRRGRRRMRPQRRGLPWPPSTSPPLCRRDRRACVLRSRRCARSRCWRRRATCCGGSTSTPSLHLPWKQHSFPILSDSSPLYLTPSEPAPLTAEEERELQLAHDRLLAVGARCAEHDIPLLVDAEYATVQPAIDYFTFAGALACNGGGRPIVHGTVQAYLRDARDRLEAMTRAAEEERVHLGVKVVRGAYLTREARLAESLGVPSPIHATIQDTHDCYNGCAAFLLERVRRGSASLMLATHNVESGQLAAAQGAGARHRQGGPQPAVRAAHGHGRRPPLGLRNAGFQVSKYLPYGPVEHIIPYLIRRAEENRGLLSASSFEAAAPVRTLIARLH
ncbi:hypothetical protein ACQ4PT_068677 [Festuca glaucescens]